MLPTVVPWLGLLGLLALKRNRDEAAWWILAPVLCGFGFMAVLRWAEPFLTGQPVRTLAQIASALPFGLAALWLSSFAIEKRGRWLTWLFMLLVVGSVGGIVLALNVWGEDDETPALVVALVSVLVIAAGLSFTGLLCRRRFHPLAVLGWALAQSIIFSFVMISPFVVFVLAANSGAISWNEVAVGVGVLAGISFLSLLPFLALSFVDRFYEERLRTLLHAEPASKPAMLGTFCQFEMEMR